MLLNAVITFALALMQPSNIYVTETSVVDETGSPVYEIDGTVAAHTDGSVYAIDSTGSIFEPDESGKINLDGSAVGEVLFLDIASDPEQPISYCCYPVWTPYGTVIVCGFVQASTCGPNGWRKVWMKPKPI